MRTLGPVYKILEQPTPFGDFVLIFSIRQCLVSLLRYMRKIYRRVGPVVTIQHIFPIYCRVLVLCARVLFQTFSSSFVARAWFRNERFFEFQRDQTRSMWSFEINCKFSVLYNDECSFTYYKLGKLAWKILMNDKSPTIVSQTLFRKVKRHMSFKQHIIMESFGINTLKICENMKFGHEI